MKTKTLKKKLKQAGYNINELGYVLHLGRTALYNKMYGITSFTFEEAMMVKKILGLSYEELEDIFLR